MVVNSLYQAKAADVAAAMEFSDDFIAQVLHDIYRRGKAQSPTDLSPELFRAILRRFNEATAEGIGASAAHDPDEDFRQALGDSFIEIANTDEGKDIISVFSQVGYEWGDDANYDGEREAQELLKSME